MTQQKEESPEVKNIIIKKKIREFLKEQRASPYYVLVSVSFSFLFSQSALWASSIIENVFSKKSVNSEDGLKSIICLIIFLFVIRIWFFFSRALIYIKETKSGEVLTFFLAFVFTTYVASLRYIWEYWSFGIALCSLVISLKSLFIWKSLNNKDKHPLSERSHSWMILSFISAIVIIVTTSLIKDKNNLIFVSLALLGFLVYFYRSFIKNEDVDEKMLVYYSDNDMELEEY